MGKDHLGYGVGAVGGNIGDDDSAFFGGSGVYDVISGGQHTDILQFGQCRHVFSGEYSFVGQQDFCTSSAFQYFRRDLATHVLAGWRGYTDEAAFIFAETDGEPHNTITPIARKVGDTFELDLTLRNNITTEEHPLGVYHPHACYHHIKKENIGLIEVMGLAVLPARLKEELELLEEYILSGRDIASNEKIEIGRASCRERV